jgi:hypothetical protein
MPATIAGMKPHIHINADGTVAMLDRPHPSSLSFTRHEPFDKKPVQIRFSRDLGFTIFGEQFDVAVELGTDEALAMMSMLTFLLRDKLNQAGLIK